MAAIAGIEETRIQETEVEPNRFTAWLLLLVLGALFIACLLNQVGVFEVDKVGIWACFAIVAVQVAAAQVLVHGKHTVRNPLTKYFMVFAIFVITLVTLVILNINAMLLLFLPLLVSTRYKSMGVSVLLLLSSVVCCVLYPFLGWLVNAWSLNIMTGYLETVCSVSILGLVTSAMPLEVTVFNLLVYLTLPQLLVVLSFGIVFLGITHSNIQALEDKLEVMSLSNQLSDDIERILSMQNEVLSAVAELIESRDSETGGHVKRMSKVAELISEAMANDAYDGRDVEYYDMVGKAAPLHDIGKITIEDSVLRKPGSLDDEEMAVIKTHPVSGARIINKIFDGLEREEFIAIASNVALYHHERFDGTGYPLRRAGKEIPLEARIVAIADAYDAMITSRRYKDAIMPKEVLERIEGEMGTYFDPDLNRYFLEALPKIEAYYATQG